MKKLLGIAIALAMCGVANAAQVKWSANNVYGTDGTTKAGNTYMAYCFLSADTSAKCSKLISVDAAVAALKKGDASSALVTKTAAAGLIGSSAYDGGWDAGTTVTAFMIIVDNTDLSKASKYLVVSEKSVTFGDPDEVATVAFGTQAENKSYSALTTTDAPEPTSGLLLLLGMAGLALKRKHA